MYRIRISVRALLRSPTSSTAAVLSLALGIGATTALFGVLKALVLDPFPYPDPERIVYVRSNPGQPLSVPDYRDIREQSRSFAEIGVYTPRRLNFGAKPSESVAAIDCTAGVLRTLGVRPALGRWLDEADERRGASPVVVVSHAFWVRSLGGDPSIIGRAIRLDGRKTTVVGVMPAQFEFASPWYQGHDYDAWVPLALPDASRGSHWLLGIARLAKGTTVEAADAEIKAIGARLARAYPDTNAYKAFLVHSIREEIVSGTAAAMRTLLVAVALLMLVACANVAGILLTRGAQRQGEFGVRLALGAPPRALVRLLLVESLLLGLLGSAAGVVLAYGGVEAARRLIPPTLIIEARRAAIQVDAWVLLFAVSVGLVSALAAGLLPALAAARTSVMEQLRGGGRSQTGSRVRQRILWRLVMAQVATAVVLANGGILLTSSYLNVFDRNRALDTRSVVTAEVALRGARYKAGEARVRFWDRLVEGVRVLPGVVHAGITTKLPLEGGSNFDVLLNDEVYDAQTRRPLVEVSRVSPQYFAAMGIPKLRGRPPENADVKGETVGVVINQALAERGWPGANPIGARLRSNEPEPELRGQVIGVVGDVRQWGAEREALPEAYLPLASDAPEDAYLVVKASGDARALVPALRDELDTLDGDLPLANVRTMAEVLSASGGRRRMSSGLVDLFTITALLLTAIGVFGSLSYSLAQRRREIGLRMVLGAMRHQVLAFVLSRAGAWVLAGLTLGLTLAAGLAPLLRSRIFGIDPLSPLCLVASVGVVGAAALLACLLPARRAVTLEPMMVLREE